MNVEKYEYGSHTEFILTRGCWSDKNVQRELKEYGIVYNGENVPILSFLVDNTSYITLGKKVEEFSIHFNKSMGKYSPMIEGVHIPYMIKALSDSLEICKYKEICIRSEYTDEQINDEYRAYLFTCIMSLGYEDIIDYHILTYDEYKEMFLNGKEIKIPCRC